MLDDAAGAPPGSRSARDADFSAYVGARRAALLRTAYLMTGDLATADDVVQTTLAKLYLAWHRVSSQDAVHAYTRQILTNEVTSHWRRAWRRRELLVDQLPEAPVDDAYDDGTSAALWELVGELAPRARAVVVLRYYEQLSEAEVAEVMGISIGTVKSQCSRALERRAAGVPVPPADLAGLRSRARSIRRRRVAAGAAASAAVVALVVPVAWGLGGLRGAPEPPVATQTPSPSPTVTCSATGVPRPEAPTDLPPRCWGPGSGWSTPLRPVTWLRSRR